MDIAHKKYKNTSLKIQHSPFDATNQSDFATIQVMIISFIFSPFEDHDAIYYLYTSQK